MFLAVLLSVFLTISADLSLSASQVITDVDSMTVSSLAGESFSTLSDQVPWIFVAIATAVVIGFALKIGPRLLKRMM